MNRHIETLIQWREAGGNESAASRAAGISRAGYQSRKLRAIEWMNTDEGKAWVKENNFSFGAVAVDAAKAEATPNVEAELKRALKDAEKRLRDIERENLSASAIREYIFNLSSEPVEPPKWTLSSPTGSKTMGIPTLFASDWHWGEVVSGPEINNVNEFNLEIARKRVKRLVERTIYLLKDCFGNPDYEGLVLALGGDMVTGDIHEELTATNDAPIMPTVIDLFGSLIWMIDELLKHFPKLFIPCVSGNHGRNTRKIQMKQRNPTNFDWLLYMLLARHYADNDRVTFMIPDGSDALFRIYNHRYLLTHGDQFRGGDSMIGALGPITRGDHKKRSRNGQIDMAYDTMMIGHWHQLIQLTRLIVNGSLKGYDEYAYQNNFGFEIPQQGLWITHPKHGITFQMPVHLDDYKRAGETSWVSVGKENVK